MAWTAADIYKISKGTNQKQNQWTANDVQKAAQGTNVSRAKKEQDNLYAIALDSYVNKNQNVKAKYGAPLKTFSLPQTSSFPSTAAKSNNVLEQVGSGAAEYGSGAAQKLKASYAPYSQKEEFDRLNEWFDQPRNQELVNKLLEKKSSYTTYAEQGTSKNAASAGDGSIDPFRTAAGKNQSGAKYTDDDLKKQGYSAEEIAQAKDYLTRYDAIPEWKKQTRRLGNLIGGIADSVAGGTVMTGELGAQSAKNIAETQKNWAKVQQEIKGDERAEKLFQLLTDVDMDYNPVYPVSKNWELALMGYGSEEIRNMRDRLAGLEVNDSIDPEQSVGYQLYRRGQDLTGAAQSGLSDGTRAVQSAVTSAAENLAVSAINPAAVLPVLSLQGASDAMGQSIEKGESAGKALAGGALKFGVGWAINSVGMADLAKTMGSDYAKDTMAGQIADFVRGMAGKSDLAQKYPAVANAISGGVDNALQAFAETYADTAIDAALGDPDAAEELFSKEHLLSALESGLSGGASGALGGAVGTGLAKLNDGDASLKGWADYYDQLDQIERAAAAAKKTQQRTQEPGMQDQTAPEGAEGHGIKYSIQTDDNGKQYVQIDSDLLENVPEEEWKGTVRDAIRDLYPDGFERDGQTISNTREGRGEFTHSKYTRGLERTDSNTYADKMRMASNLNEVISTSGPAENEQANHKNAESFNRGKINIRVGTKDYNADVLTAIKQDGREVFYDVVNIQPTKIKAPTETADDRTSGNRSMEADETSRRTDAESVASGGRGQPGNSEVSIAPERASVNGQDVEKAGKTVETLQKSDGPAAEGRDYADTELKADPAALDESSWERSEQKRTAQELVARGGVSTKATQGIVDAMPDGVGAAVYAQAAKSMYRMGVTQDVSFERALELTGSGGMGGAVRQVLALGKRGENALKLAYLYGSDEAETYNAAKASEIGSGTGVLTKDAGTYSVNGQLRTGATAEDAFIELGAKSSGTAVKRMMEGLKNGAKGFIQTAAGKMYLSGEAGSETMMHETFHALNEWSPETGQAVMDRLLKYLVEANGMESTEKLVQNYLDRYAANGQKVTYNQALEEVTADAMETVFGTADGFRDFVRQQAAEAKMNAQARGAIGKVMDKIETLLQKVLADVERFLKQEPTNAAAKAAKSLTEEQLKDLRELYFEHQAAAGERYRDAIDEQKSGTGETKNAASSKTEETAVKYSIDAGFEQAIDTLDDKTSDYMVRVGTTSEALKSIGVKDQTILWNAGKIRKILAKHSDGMTKDIIKQVPQVLEHPVVILHSSEEIGKQQGKNYGGRVYMFGEVRDTTGKLVSVSLELLPTRKNGLLMDNIVITSAYGKGNVQNALNSDQLLYVDPNKKRTAAWLGSTRLQLPVPPTMYGSMGKLTYFEGSVKMMEPNSRNAKLAEFLTRDESGKYQLDVDADAVDAAKETGLGDVAAQTETVRKAVEAGGNKRVSDESLTAIARAVKSDIKSRMSAADVTERLKALSEYLSGAKEVSWEDANGFMMDLAEQLMYKSAKKNDELWKAYPELHEMGMKVEKGSTAFQELVYRYGSWANAKRELGRHGVKITQLPEGQHSRWDADFRELQEIGKGYFPDEVPNSAADALEAMANAHDAIKPVLENAFEEDWDGAKQDIAMQLWQRYLASPELANEANKGLREDLSRQWEELRKQAKAEAQDARAEAQLRMAEKHLKDAQWASRELAKRTLQERARRDAQINKVRAAREKDNTRRSVRRLTTQLNGIITKDKAGKGLPAAIANQVLVVARLANENTQNKKMLGEIERLSRMIPKDGGSSTDRVSIEWENSGLNDMLESWLDDVNDSREIALERVNKNIERAQKRLDALQESANKTGKDYSKDEADLKAYLAHLKMQRMAYEDGGMAMMTADQLRGLREILEQTVYIIRNENKLLGEEEQADIDDFAQGMQDELRKAKGLNFEDGILGTLSQKTAGYRLNTMGIQRTFERMGGYKHGGFMEKAGEMLNQGQYKRTKLIVEGTKFFDNVTGTENLKKMDRFTHELVDIGLRTEDKRAWKVTREQVVALYIQAQNMQGLHHMTHGGLKIMNMEYAVKGDRERALHDTQTIRIGDLQFDEGGHILNEEGTAADELEVMRQMGRQQTTLLAELDKVISAQDEMGEYCRTWLDDYKKYSAFTKQQINETSMVLNGRMKATVVNYIPLRVDEATRGTENVGIRYDNSVGNEGFLKSRVNSSKPIWLDGIGSVVNTSIENVAQYAGMAIPLRNMQKLLNTQIGGQNINAEFQNAWGTEGAKYMEKALADLYPQKGTPDYGDGAMAKLRSAAAGAVLTANLNVTLLQAASLPTAAAELGWGSTGHAAVQFAKNINPVNKFMSALGLKENSLKAVEAEIMEHGDALLQYRLRGTKNGELGTMGEVKRIRGQVHDAIVDPSGKSRLARGVVELLDGIGNSITLADEVTVAALWNGAKDYVVKNPTEFDADAQQKGSAAYWNAVNRQFQRTVERTQPNYTPMQRTGMQRSKNQALKFLMMYSTQRQQNCQIVVAAGEDRAAQQRRYDAHPTEENKAALEKAHKRLGWAISSQFAAASVISLMDIFVKYLLHRRKDLEDENGDMNWKSVGMRFISGVLESLISNPVGGSEIYSGISVIAKGSDYDALSVSGLSNINDFVAQITSQMKLVAKDTSAMDEDELNAYGEKVKRGWMDIAGAAAGLKGVPYTNVMKYADAVGAYMDDWNKEGTLFTFSDLPSSATGQYDRLFNAIQSGDSDEAKAALKKLDQMGKTDQVDSQLKSRLKKYDEDILDAAKARNEGKDKDRQDATKRCILKLYDAMGIERTGKGDAAKREEVIDLVTSAVNAKADELLKAKDDGSSYSSVYGGLTDALESGRAKDVNDEIKRLLTSGKSADAIKSAITGQVKDEYLAGSSADRKKLETMLLKLRADGKALYEEKNFETWLKDAEKQKATAKKDEWKDVR